MPSFAMPNVGEGVTEGEVTRWLKQVGDFVARDEPVVEIETDKAVVEIPSPFEGTLSEILVAAGEIVPVGTPLAEIATDGRAPSEVAAAAPAAEASEPAAPAPTSEPEPAPEAAAALPLEEPQPEPLVDATPEPPPPPPTPAPAPAPAVTAAAPAPSPPSSPSAMPGYSPAVLKLATEHGVDLAQVPGSGANGRVTRKDVLRYLEHPPPTAEAAAAPVTPAAPPPVAAPPAPPSPPRSAGESELVPLSATRRAIARHMAEAHATIPLAWMAIEADVSGLVELRRSARAAFEEAHGVRLSYMPFFVRAIVQTLQQHPALNASYAEDGVLRHARLDMGIAVATDSGLLVPVLRSADSKSLPQLAGELEDLAARARARTLAHDELVGGTLTIDNTGAFGSLISQPIVPLGQVAIVTTEAIRRELRVLPGEDDAFAPRSVMHLAISFDHRALDGLEVGEFMAALKARLEAIGPDEPLS